jgi:hypothetical protein
LKDGLQDHLPKSTCCYYDTLAGKIPLPTSNKINLNDLRRNSLRAKPDGAQGLRYTAFKPQPFATHLFRNPRAA